MEVSVTGRIMEDVQKLAEVEAKCLHVRVLTHPQLMVVKLVLVHFKKADHVIQTHAQVCAYSLSIKTRNVDNVLTNLQNITIATSINAKINVLAN